MSLEYIKKKLLGKLIRFRRGHSIYGFISDLIPDFDRSNMYGIPIILEAFDCRGVKGVTLLHSFNNGLEYHDGEKWTSMPSEYYYIPISI